MIRIATFLVFILTSFVSIAQNDTVSVAGVVLLKNNGMLPLKHLDSLSIRYLNNPELEKYGRRYTENEGANNLQISSVFDKDKVSRSSGVLDIW
jgi:hypothetical protein